MEKNFNTDNFEHLLREATDDFRMYPEKRVWHGIYNDLHPAKKWPSFAVLLLLITSIMYVGTTNPDKGGQTSAVVSENQNPSSGQLSPGGATLPTGKNAAEVTVTTNRNTGGADIGSNTKISNSENSLYIASSQQDVRSGTTNPVNDPAMKAILTADNTDLSQFNKQPADKTITKSDATASLKSSVLYPEASSEPVSPLNITSTKSDDNLGEEVAVSQLQPQAALENLAKTDAQTAPTPNKIAITAALSGLDETGWMEDYALRNKRSRDKWKGRMAYQVYVTPSIGYRSLTKNTDYSLTPTNALVANPYAASNNNYSLNHSSAINLEIGTGVIYSASKFVRLKVGLQINYTNYSINAQELNHPTFTSLMLTNTFTNTPVLSTRTTTLANTPGPTSRYLNNNTYQVSIPVGADFKVAGNEKLKVYVSGTLQPTYILGGQAYLISSDMKNYVAEENFLRKNNLNGSVETFITYKTRSGVTLNAGPQFRYQFFSTYNSMYTYDEKLYNLGVKLGMTKNF